MTHALVTAGTAGLGFETARGLIRAGYTVTVVGRDHGRGAEAVERLGTGARFRAADLSSLKEVRALGAEIAQEGPLHLLVNNAGGMYAQRWESTDGIEGSFVLNHLTPYLLTTALLPALEAGAPSRVVQVTSGSMMAAVPDFRAAEVPGEHYGFAVTGRAKLANLAWALEVAPEWQRRGITLVVADPGGAATPNAAAMEQHMLPPAMRPMWEMVQEGVKRPAAEAAAVIIEAATAPELTGRPGAVLGNDSLRGQVTPEITVAVRRLTEQLLAH